MRPSEGEELGSSSGAESSGDTAEAASGMADAIRDHNEKRGLKRLQQLLIAGERPTGALFGLACALGRPKCAELLMESGAPTDNPMTVDGHSPLHLTLMSFILSLASGHYPAHPMLSCAVLILERHREEEEGEQGLARFSARHVFELKTFCRGTNPEEDPALDFLPAVQLLLDANVDPNMPGVSKNLDHDTRCAESRNPSNLPLVQ